MAINDGSEQVASMGGAPEPKQTRAGQGGQGGWNFHSGGMFGAPISRGVGSELYGKLKTALIEVYKQAHENVEVALIDLDNINEPALAFSSIVVAIRNKKAPQIGVSYHILLLESTGDDISPIIENINSSQIEILRKPSDAIDDVVLTKALEKVRKAFPSSGNYYMCDGCVIPRNFNPEDKYAVHRLALNAGVACGTELEIRTPDFHDINLANIQHDSSLTINIGFSHQQMEDAVGAPMRSDLLLNFASKKNTNNVGGKYTSPNAGDKEARISEVSAFVDLAWAPVVPVGVMNVYQQAMPNQTQKYAARMVITNLASNYSYTPGSVLLAISTAMSLRDDNNWIQAFRPSPASGNEIDLGDIGALNIEANLSNEPSGFGTRIDTKSDNFKLEDLGQLVGALIQPGVIISMDCPEYGPQSFYLSVFPAAANGSDAALRVIYEAAQQLTNNNFGKYFPKGSQMFVDQNNRIHNGTWTDRSGQKRDIRDIDHLAVCNLVGERNPQLIRDWSDTFYRTQFPLMQRLHARKKMISGLTNETAVFTGFSQRVTFSATFLEALARGIKDTGLQVRVNTPLTGNDFNNQRGIAGFAGQALMVPGQSFMQQGGIGYSPQFMASGGVQQGRW